MTRDPVCNMEVDEFTTSERGVYLGRTYYFCSSDCKERFNRSPELFLAKGETDDAVQCISCQTEIKEGFYKDGKGPFCCEKCYFRNKYLGGVIDRIEGVYLVTIEAFVAAIDAKEHEVGNHSYRVTQFTMVLAREIGIKGRDLVDLYCGSILHDIGKIGIPDQILLKRGRLTDEELNIMKRHPEIGFGIVNHIGYLKNAAEIIRSHHEHFDGSGYPRGLKRDEIVLGARIFAISDTLDALTVERPYRPAVSFEQAKTHILNYSGSQFDPEVVEAFFRAEEELKYFTSKIVF